MPESSEYCVYCGAMISGEEKRGLGGHACFAIRRAKRELTESEARPVCPWCDSNDVAPIIYGFPSTEILEYCREKKAVWGGCCVSGLESHWGCLDCKREWGRSHEDESNYCSMCGRRSKNTWCSACNERILMDVNSMLAEANKELDVRIRARKTIITFLFLLLTIPKATQNPTSDSRLA